MKKTKICNLTTSKKTIESFELDYCRFLFKYPVQINAMRFAFHDESATFFSEATVVEERFAVLGKFEDYEDGFGEGRGSTFEAAFDDWKRSVVALFGRLEVEGNASDDALTALFEERVEAEFFRSEIRKGALREFTFEDKRELDSNYFAEVIWEDGTFEKIDPANICDVGFFSLKKNDEFVATVLVDDSLKTRRVLSVAERKGRGKD